MLWLTLLKILKNPIFQKILIYAVITMAVLYCIRLYGNAQWSKGEAKGRLNTTQLIEKAKKEEWKRIDTLLKNNNEALVTEQNINTELKKQLAADRTEINKNLKQGLAAIQAAQGQAYANINNIPATQLDNALRILSRELRTTE
jgi:hypothetical protein